MLEANNNSGQGKGSPVPEEIKGWNWGALLLNWIWGIGNSTYIALFMFIPFANLIMPFVLGARGNEWAWQNRHWDSIDQFKSVQRKWAWAGLAIVLVLFPSCMALPILVMKQTEAYALSLNAIRDNASAQAALGAPIEPGFFVMGSVSTSGPEGQASLQYSLQGPGNEGDAFVYARKSVGMWQLLHVVVEVDSTGERITVVAPPETDLSR